MNYDGDIVFEDDDDDGSWSALTEDVTELTHGTPFSPVVFQPRVRGPGAVAGFSAPYEKGEGGRAPPKPSSFRNNNTVDSMNGSDAAKAMLSMIQTPKKQMRFAGGNMQNHHDDDDAMILAQSRQSQNRRMEVGGPRGPALSIQSPENFGRSRAPHYNAIGLGIDNRARGNSRGVNNDDGPRNSNNMGYLPSRFVDAKTSSLRSTFHTRVGRPISSLSLPQELQQNSNPNWVDNQSPSNESQNTLSTIRSNRSITSTRSRRSAVSYHSSTSMSILHGEVINLEGNSVFVKDAAANLRRHTNQEDKMTDRYIHVDQNGRQESSLSGMQIGGFNSEGRRSGGHSLLSSQQEKYQGDGSEPVFTFGIASERILNAHQRATKLGKDAKLGVVKIKGRASSVAKHIVNKYYRPPLSPRSRELKDLEYLKQSHKEKFNHLKIPNGNDKHENESFLSNHDEDEFFDFVIVLTPQESYEYWANLLDFREEYLGLDSSDVWGRELESPGGVSTNTTDSRASAEQMLPEDNTEREFTSPQSSVSEENLSTPLTGLLRRKTIKTPPPSKNTPSRRFSRQTSQYFDSHQKSRFSQFSRSNLRSPFEGTPLKKGISRLSMFERAIQSPTMTSGRSRTFSHNSYRSSLTGRESGTLSETPVTTFSRQPISTVRRRFGNPTMPSTAQAAKAIGNMSSPPVRSLKREKGSEESILLDSVRSKGLGNQQKTIDNENSLKIDVKMGMEGDEENENPNIIQTVEDMPNPVIPRGFAVRKNGNIKFLSALQGGIVLRRHCPNREAMFCKLSSDNGGETIKYQMVDSEEAMAAFKSQRIRYNRNFKECTSPASLRAHCAEWSCSEDPSDDNSEPKFIPNHVASQKYREKFNREHGVIKRLYDVAMNEANSGLLDGKDIVALHPATKVDRRKPGFDKEALGTASFRRSLSHYDNQFSFSLITSSGQPFMKATSDNQTDIWQKGEGSERLFKTLDFEAATEGEYWLFLRGLLLLYRDNMNKKLNSIGNTGIGGGGNQPEGIGGIAQTRENRLQQDVYVEPSMVGRLEKLVVKMRKLNDDYIRGAVMPGAVPPPSDYFLGFKSPGTQIWSRLRWAGLETQRVFSVDPRKVMIKIRCPEDRLTDVAEVLRLKIKTNDGSYAQFHEDIAHIFKSHDDHLDIPNIYRGGMASLLRSKDRQTIIDFIIGSRIRDSGAELSQTSQIGKMIEAKVPLHMPRKLDSLYNSWVCYWKREHWIGIEESSTAGGSHQSSIEEGNFTKKSPSKDHRPVPNFLTRFFVEAFNQPLDSIEDYFGEKVTFYFAWMQHCSVHLLFLAFFGMIVTFCQVATKNYDHWLRPWFSLMVMVWTFIVLVNWKKRSNYLAYRWGSLDYKEVETNRPEFYGKYMRDPITDEWVIKYPIWKRWLKYMISVPISVFFAGLALFLILLVHANRDLQMARYVKHADSGADEFDDFEFTWKNIGKKEYVGDVKVGNDQYSDPTYWSIMIFFPCVLGLCIPILNIILMFISVKLNDFENYRTDAEYRTHLILKVFSFRFVSQFGTVYYYAFISVVASALTEEQASTMSAEEQAQYVKDVFQNGMLRMGTSLVIYTTVAHWWNIILQVYVFIGIRNIRHYFYRKRLRKELKKIELLEEDYNTNERCDAEVREITLINKRILLDQAQDDLWMEVMCPPHDSFPEYITAVIQFSFVVCFSFILPCVPLLVLINYLLSMRFDAYKVCRGRRRPLAKRTGGIGVWEHVLHIVAVMAVVTNCWLVAFFDSGFREIGVNIGSTATVFLVVAWEHVMLLIKYFIGNTMSTLPKEIRDEIKQKQHENEKERRENMRLKTEQTRRMKREKSISSSFRLLSVTPDSTSRAGSSFIGQESKKVDAESRDSHMTKTAEIGGRLQTIESFEESIDSRSIGKCRPPSSIVHHERKNVDGGFAVPRMTTPEISGRLQTIVSREESYDEGSITNIKPGELCDSMSGARSSIIYHERKNVNGGFLVPHMTTPEISDNLQTIESLEESYDKGSITNSKSDELYDSVLRAQRDVTHLESENVDDDYPFEDSFDEGSIINSKPGELFEC